MFVTSSRHHAINHNKMAVVCGGNKSHVFLLFVLVIRLGWGRVHHVELEVWLVSENGRLFVTVFTGINVKLALKY